MPDNTAQQNVVVPDLPKEPTVADWIKQILGTTGIPSEAKAQAIEAKAQAITTVYAQAAKPIENTLEKHLEQQQTELYPSLDSAANRTRSNLWNTSSQKNPFLLHRREPKSARSRGRDRPRMASTKQYNDDTAKPGKETPPEVIVVGIERATTHGIDRRHLSVSATTVVGCHTLRPTSSVTSSESWQRTRASPHRSTGRSTHRNQNVPGGTPDGVKVGLPSPYIAIVRRTSR